MIFALNQLDGEKKPNMTRSSSRCATSSAKKWCPYNIPECRPGLQRHDRRPAYEKNIPGSDGGVPVIRGYTKPRSVRRAQELHRQLVEAAAENDETLMEKFFEEEHLTEDEMRLGIRKGLVDRSIFPVFCVSALKDMGVRRMMEFLGNVVPFVEDMPALRSTLKRRSEASQRRLRSACICSRPQ